MADCIHSINDLTLPEHSAEKLSLPANWSCSNKPVDGCDRCLFHLSESQRQETGLSAEDITKEAKARITNPESSSELIGAKLPELRITDSAITGASDDRLDLRCSEIRGELRINDIRIELPLLAQGSTIEGGIDLSSSTFVRKVNFHGSRLKGASESKGVTFAGEAVFSRILSSYSLRLRDSTVFEQGAVFSYTEIKGTSGTLDIRGVSVNGPLHCRGIDIPRLNCEYSIFRGFVGMGGAYVGGDAKFTDVHFRALARFGRGDNGGGSDPTEIEGTLEFHGVLADQEIGFRSVKFRDDLDLSDTTFSRSVDFSLISLSGDVDLTGAMFNDELILKPQYASAESGQCIVSCSNTELTSGTLSQAGHDSSDPILYDIADSSIGDVSFLLPIVSGGPHRAENYTYEIAELKYIRFIRTKFSGFDFTSYREKLEGHWKIHEFGNSIEPSVLDHDLTASDLELTYMYAKQGADKIGDNTAASQFFQHEMKYRTERYRLRESSGLRDRLRYPSLRFWGLINYTESPIRVFALGSLTSFFIFPISYFLTTVVTTIDPPYPEAPYGAGYVLFSGESFISLVHSPGAQITDWPLRFLSILEGFLGAFIIALFVFSLTRSVYR